MSVFARDRGSGIFGTFRYALVYAGNLDGDHGWRWTPTVPAWADLILGPGFGGT